MPYANEHSCRLRDPGDFDKNSFRRTEVQKGLSIITGKLKDNDKRVSQAFRYDKKIYTEEQAKKHCDQNNGLFDPAKKYLIIYND